MKKLLHALTCLAIASCIIPAAQAQSVTLCDMSSCYRDTVCDSPIAPSATYTFATVHNIYGSRNANIDLQMDVYSPCTLPAPITNPVVSSNCSGCKRPFILLIHPGSFREGCRTIMADECAAFAERGYVAATIDYRLGWYPGDEIAATGGTCTGIPFCYPDSCNLPKSTCSALYADSNRFAVYRALQDAHAALRFIVHYAAQLNIDTNFIYIGGQSAGAVAAVNLAFLSQAELNTTYPTVVAALGRVDTAGNSFTDHFKIAGIYDNWGSVVDTSLINGNANRIPMIAFHGWNDNVVPYVSGHFLGCASYDIGYGSRAIYQRLTNKYPNLPVELFSDKGGHGILMGNSGVSLYRVQKAVCFFRNARMGGTDTNFVQVNTPDNQVTVADLQTWFPLNCGIVTPARKLNPAVLYNDEAAVTVTQYNVIKCTYSLQSEKNVSIRVYDMTGRIISRYTATRPAGRYEYQSAPVTVPGIYVVSVACNGEPVTTQKVVIE